MSEKDKEPSVVGAILGLGAMAAAKILGVEDTQDDIPSSHTFEPEE